jgi:hypothetical protein
MEATMFTGWIYDHLKPQAAALKVAHPLMLRAIAAAKKKNDRIDAGKICDCLRCDFLPESYMAPTAIRERRRTLRYRNLLVRQMVQMKNKVGMLLMEAGVSYNKQKLHKVGYFRELLASNPDIDPGLRSPLRQCREMVVRLGKMEAALIRSLQQDGLLAERVERLMSIPAIGPITALTWTLEIGEVQRFSSIKKAISYCGLCGAEKSSGNTVQPTPLSWPQQHSRGHGRVNSEDYFGSQSRLHIFKCEGPTDESGSTRYRCRSTSYRESWSELARVTRIPAQSRHEPAQTRSSDNVIQQILRHANVTTTMNIYVKTATADAENAMKTLETMCATTVQLMALESSRVM